MTHITLQFFILAGAILSVLISWWSMRTASPILAILSRWTRWAFVAVLLGGSIHIFEWTGYPLSVLIAVSFLGWFLLETAYNWLAIHALNRSELPLFPRFEENNQGDEWPSNPRFIRIKDWLRRNGFKKSQALVAFIENQVIMRMSAFENSDKTVRLHILFLPNAKGTTAECFSINSQTKDGTRIITDNIFLPFGGFYPDSWYVERKPLTRSVQSLFDRHMARVDAHNGELIPFEDAPREQINYDQHELEKLNRELGFLHKRTAENLQGRLTPAGRARIWQEIWTLSYLGRPLNY